MNRFILVVVASAAFACTCPAQIVINEVNVGSTDWLEIANLGSTTQSVGGWQVLVSGDNSPNAAVTASFTIPGGITLAAGEYLVITESSGLSVPSVPAGVTLLYFGNNIFWHGSAVGQGGVCTLTNGTSGVDTVNWLSPANTDPVPPASFPVSIPSLSGDAIYRNSLATPGTVADWSSSTSGTPGDRNPGQDPPPGLEVQLSFTATTFIIDVNTAPMPVPFGEVYTLFSSETWTPTGSGPLFGVGLDAFEQLFVPLVFGLPFHALLDANGLYTYSFFFPVPPGLHIEAVSILVDNAALSRVSDVFVLDS